MVQITVTTIATSATIDDAVGVYLVDPSAGNITLTLMDIAGYDGVLIIVRRIDPLSATPNSLSIQTSHTQTINDTGTVTPSLNVNQGTKVQLVSYGGNWYVC
jgi:hypothetical protein